MKAIRKPNFQGPFLRTGNTFFDADPPRAATLPENVSQSRDYIQVSRILLEACRRHDYALMAMLPDYLDRHRNGILWTNAALLYAFATPQPLIEAFAHRFQRDVFEARDPLVTQFVFSALLESGIPKLIQASTRVLPYLHPASDFGDIARLYAVITEPNVGFDPKASEVIAAFGRFSPQELSGIMAERMAELVARFPGSIRIHSGRPVVIGDVLTTLADTIRSPYFFVRIHFEKVLLEAFTGFDLSSGFHELQMRSTDFHDALSRLSDSVDLNNFKSGQRYFFGQPI